MRAANVPKIPMEGGAGREGRGGVGGGGGGGGEGGRVEGRGNYTSVTVQTREQIT